MFKENFRILIKNNAPLFASLLSIQFVGFFGIFVKYVQSEYNSGYQVAARTMGLTDRHELSFLAKLSFYREDVLINLIILPFGLFLILYLIKRKWSDFYIFIIILSASALSIIFYIDLYSLGNIGRFLSFDLLVDSIRWAAKYPETIRDYLTISGLFKLLFIISFSILVILLSKHARFSVIIAKLTIVVTIVSILFSTVAYSVNIPSFPLHRSVIRSTIASLKKSNFTPIDLSQLAGKALEIYYHNFSGLNLPESQKQESIFRGNEIDADILLFVVETMPNAVFDFTKDTKELPAISKLLDRAFVSSKHCTTYPSTTSAIFSLLSSCYPIGISKNYLSNVSRYRKFGLMSILRENSYQTSVYSPMANGYYADIPMYKLLGGEKVYLSPEKPFSSKQVEKKTQNFLRTLPCSKTFLEKQLKNVHDLLYFDLMAFEKMKADIISLKTSNKRFAFLFIPQFSHGPWLNLYNRKEIANIGRDLMLTQLKWLDGLVSFLARKQWLSNTIILITSDHGVRTKEEYPAIPAGMTNNYSFNVPFLLYLPNTLNSKMVLEHITSHIDIMPTILELLDIPRNSYEAQGLPIWDDSQRTVFFLADGYFGADAYFCEPYYFMYQSAAEAILRSEDIDFDYGQDILLHDNKVLEKLNILNSISKQWAENNKLK
jgi:hypothetical protein